MTERGRNREKKSGGRRYRGSSRSSKTFNTDKVLRRVCFRERKEREKTNRSEICFVGPFLGIEAGNVSGEKERN